MKSPTPFKLKVDKNLYESMVAEIDWGRYSWEYLGHNQRANDLGNVFHMH